MERMLRIVHNLRGLQIMNKKVGRKPHFFAKFLVDVFLRILVWDKNYRLIKMRKKIYLGFYLGFYFERGKKYDKHL